jgi:hypothetical protein
MKSKFLIAVFVAAMMATLVCSVGSAAASDYWIYEENNGEHSPAEVYDITIGETSAAEDVGYWYYAWYAFLDGMSATCYDYNYDGSILETGMFVHFWSDSFDIPTYEYSGTYYHFDPTSIPYSRYVVTETHQEYGCILFGYHLVAWSDSVAYVDAAWLDQQ